MTPRRNSDVTSRLVILCSIVFISCATSLMAATGNGLLEIEGISRHQAGTLVQLGNTANYDWWYGCSPTAAGMLLGYYDRNGYNGQNYGNLVPGGTAEAETFVGSGALINPIIASSGHIADFYQTGDGGWGDDNQGQLHSFDCLADFMGTSQDSAYNINGATWFTSYDDGSPFTEEDALYWDVQDEDGMYGIGEYLNYVGYDAGTLYTQLIDTLMPAGFTFEQYMAEIDAGRPVLIHVDNTTTGHTMLGYGYDDENDQIYVYDTWDSDPGTMTWGGTYAGMDQWGVCVLELAPVPEPSSIVLCVFCLASMLPVYLVRRRRRSR